MKKEPQSRRPQNLDGADGPQLVLDGRGSIVETNQAAADLLGLARHHLQHKPFVLFVAAEDHRALFGALRRARQERAPAELLTCHLVPRTATARRVHLVISPQPGQEPRFQVTVRTADESEDRAALIEQLTQLERRYREAISSLHASLRPRTPRWEDIDLASASQTPGPDIPFGGDLCDWQLLPTGDLHLCVIDAAGRGLLATRVALTVRSTLRTLALAGHPFDELLAQTERLCEHQEPGATAAVTLARYDPRLEQLSVTVAGQPPPVVRRADGRIEELELAAPPLGYGMPERRPIAHLTIGAGDLAVLYTDGLIHGQPTPRQGIERLTYQLEAMELDAEREPIDAMRIAHHLLSDADEFDDALVAVLRRRNERELPTEQPSRSNFQATMRYAGDERVSEVRQELADWLEARPVSREAIHTTLLIVSELASNAVHASRQRTDVGVWLDGDDIQIEVVDDGRGLRLSDLEPEGVPNNSHLGLRIVENLCHSVQVVPSAAGTVVRCRVRATP